jgi:hypothetical protein
VAVESRRAHHQVTFAVLAAGVGAFALLQSLVLAALAGLLIPSARSLRRAAGEPEHAEMAMVAGGTVVGDKSE